PQRQGGHQERPPGEDGEPERPRLSQADRGGDGREAEAEDDQLGAHPPCLGVEPVGGTSSGVERLPGALGGHVGVHAGTLACSFRIGKHFRYRDPRLLGGPSTSTSLSVTSTTSPAASPSAVRTAFLIGST